METYNKKMNFGNFEELDLLIKPKINGFREYLSFLEFLVINASKNQIETTKSKTTN